MRWSRAIRYGLMLTALTGSVAVSVAAAQDSRLPRDEYFRLIGKYEAFASLDTFLASRLADQRPDLPEDRRLQMSEFFAFVMTASGLSAQSAAALEAEGLDVVRAITADTRPFGEQSLLTDLVVVGDVIATEIVDDTNDGFYSSALVDVRSVLKGYPPGDTIVIRLREPRAGSRRDIRPERDQSYLFLLSHGMYRYAAANHAARNEGWLPAEAGPSYYSIYRIYEMIDGQLNWGGFTREDTDDAMADIQRVHHILAVLSE